ncbi:MAG: hypothetical protein JW797_09180 [Bradymonadales bacterium]|nr:hypothetical protein [Bradymonadales bacterium]
MASPSARSVKPFSVALLGLVLGLLTSCPPTTGPAPPEDAGQPQWIQQEIDEAEVPPTAPTTSPPPLLPEGSQLPVLVGTTDVSPPSETTPPVNRATRSYSLKERFLSGQRLRRRLRVERHFQVSLESDRPAEVEGATEVTREYVVEILEASVGQIQQSSITVLTDTRRLLPVGEVRPRLPVSAGPLQGATLSCQISESGRYLCESADALGPLRDLGQITPQRLGMWPGKMVSVGESWELHGREANAFLDLEGADVVVRFVLEDPAASYHRDSCCRVAYSLDGTQPFPLAATTQTANLTGSGEFYYCQEQSAVLYHTQQRTISLQIIIHQGNDARLLDREVTQTLEEETSVDR